MIQILQIPKEEIDCMVPVFLNSNGLEYDELLMNDFHSCANSIFMIRDNISTRFNCFNEFGLIACAKGKILDITDEAGILSYHPKPDDIIYYIKYLYVDNNGMRQADDSIIEQATYKLIHECLAGKNDRMCIFVLSDDSTLPPAAIDTIELYGFKPHEDFENKRTIYIKDPFTDINPFELRLK